MSDSNSPVWRVNGHIAEPPNVDRGLQFGDGLFETMLASNGRIPLLAGHLRRLEQGCRRLHIPFPGTRTLEDDIRQRLPASGQAVIKLIVTAGDGGRGYARASEMQPLRYTAVFPAPHRAREALSIMICDTRLARQPLLAGLKHCNRLEQVLARREAMRTGVDEGLMLDTDGYVIEGISANLFLVRNERLITPSLSHSGVSGVMREHLIGCAQAWGVEVQVTSLKLDDILGAEEVFMCNSLMGVRPVGRLQNGEHGHEWGPGELTRQLGKNIEDEVFA